MEGSMRYSGNTDFLGVIFVLLNESMMLIYALIFYFLPLTDLNNQDLRFSLIGVWRDEDSQQGKWIKISPAADGSLMGYEVIKEGNGYVNGQRVLWDLVLQDDKNSLKGKLKPPDGNIELSVVIRMSGENKIQLEASKFFVKRTRTLVRETSVK
jgi:hypothetical protein